ncbi:hypothetical protein Hanom_Chr15g01386661 [Helianthus anomalus]
MSFCPLSAYLFPSPPPHHLCQEPPTATTLLRCIFLHYYSCKSAIPHINKQLH